MNRLRDSSSLVRQYTIVVLTHLILNDMIKVHGSVSEMALCLRDDVPSIADRARLFFLELSKKVWLCVCVCVCVCVLSKGLVLTCNVCSALLLRVMYCTMWCQMLSVVSQILHSLFLRMLSEIL